MPRKPGVILELPDKRKVIVYNEQPLLEHGKIVMTLVDDKYNVIKGDDNKPKTILKDRDDYNLEVQEKVNKYIGHVD